MTDGDVVELGEYETVPGHACADVSLFAPDLDVMAYMLQDLRTLLRSADAGKVDVWRHRPFTWSVHTLHRRTVVCEPVQIRDSQRVCIVGFFGNRRTEFPWEKTDDIDVSLIDEFKSYPGILSYTSMELADDYWANLVVHAEPDDREAWRTSVRPPSCGRALADALHRASASTTATYPAASPAVGRSRSTAPSTGTTRSSRCGRRSACSTHH